jgi:hypothetical protein
LLCKRSAITAQLLRYRCTIAALSLHNCCFIAPLSLNDHFAIALQMLRNRGATVVLTIAQPLLYRSVIAQQLFRKRCAIALQKL